MSFFLHLVGVDERCSPIFSRFAFVALLTQRAGYARDDFYGDACKVVSDFSGSIGC